MIVMLQILVMKFILQCWKHEGVTIHYSVEKPSSNFMGRWPQIIIINFGFSRYRVKKKT